MRTVVNSDGSGSFVAAPSSSSKGWALHVEQLAAGLAEAAANYRMVAAGGGEVLEDTRGVLRYIGSLTALSRNVGLSLPDRVPLKLGLEIIRELERGGKLIAEWVSVEPRRSLTWIALSESVGIQAARLASAQNIEVREWRSRIIAGKVSAAELRSELCRRSSADDTRPLYMDDSDAFFDLLFGIEHGKSGEFRYSNGCYGYDPLPIRTVTACLDSLELTSDDVFYDLGSGRGRAVVLAATTTPARCIGIELQRDLHESAMAVVSEMAVTRAHFVNGDVRSIDLADATVMFMYNPFEPPVVKDLCKRLIHLAKRATVTVAAVGTCVATAEECLGGWSVTPVGARASIICSNAGGRKSRASSSTDGGSS